MTRPQNFRIDADEVFPTLRNAPIVEAVVEFKAPPTTEIQKETLHDVLRSAFQEHEIKDQVQLEAGFTGSPAGMSFQHKSHWDGFRITSKDKKHVCQWKRSSLAISQLPPYEDWETFLVAALTYWRAYREFCKPEIIEGVGVRFISQINLTGKQKISDFVEKTPPPLKGLGLRSSSYFHQDTIPVKGYPYEIRLIRAMQRPADATEKSSTLIVDIDVTTTEAVTDAELERTLNEMRFLKNKVFFTFMKNAETNFK